MKFKALVVDDDLQTCEMVRTILETHGVQAFAQSSSGSAARRLQAERFDFVLIDLRMPAPDGLALIRLLRTSGVNRKSLVVLMTGDTSRQVMTEGFEAGANFFLLKPVDSNRLLRLIRVSESTIHREKRRYQQVPLRCVISARSAHGTLQGHTLDLSLGGMLVQVQQSLPEGDVVSIEMNLPSVGPPICPEGRVVRVHEDGCMGIEFTKVTDADAERLQEALLPLILRAFEMAAVQP